MAKGGEAYLSSKNRRPEWLTQDSFFSSSPFPFKDLNNLSEEVQLDAAMIEDYVKNTINQAISGNDILSKPSELRYETFDTHKFLVVKCHVPMRIHPENLWVQVNRTHIKINGLPKEHVQIIQLPAPVQPSQSIATYKQSSLQIKMPKLSSGRYHDVQIRFL